MRLAEESEAFRAERERERRNAAQVAALYLACGLDMKEALAATGQPRALMLLRVQRLLERERLRGQRRHWTYDLNRHIALKQALDRLRQAERDHAENAEGRHNAPPF